MPPAKEQPSYSTKEVNPLVLVEPVDRTGQAAVRKRTDKVVPVFISASVHDYEPTDDAEPPLENEKSVSVISKTTAWRKRKAATVSAASANKELGKINSGLTLKSVNYIVTKNSQIIIFYLKLILRVHRPQTWHSRELLNGGKKSVEHSEEKKVRKQYSCRNCGKATSSEGHTQFRGNRYHEVRFVCLPLLSVRSVVLWGIVETNLAPTSLPLPKRVTTI